MLLRTIATATKGRSSSRLLSSLSATTGRASLSSVPPSCSASPSATAPGLALRKRREEFKRNRIRWLSSDSGGEDSHSDFAPKRKVPQKSSLDEALALIDEHVKSNRIMLYMKGSPSQPMCGFSATVVQIMKSAEVNFASVNVLDYPDIREGIKKYSDWPTIPQLYVDGEFIGGCDIVTSMNESGELAELLKPGTEE